MLLMVLLLLLMLMFPCLLIDLFVCVVALCLMCCCLFVVASDVDVVHFSLFITRRETDKRDWEDCTIAITYTSSGIISHTQIYDNNMWNHSTSIRRITQIQTHIRPIATTRSTCTTATVSCNAHNKTASDKHEQSSATTSPSFIDMIRPHPLLPFHLPVVGTPRTNANTSQSPLPPLFTPLLIRGGLLLKNRLAVSPMCTYSSIDGYFNDWHLSHLSQFASGGAALIITEATAVSAEGRITPHCTGLWHDQQIEGLARTINLIHALGSKVAVQLSHAGRKASTRPPFSRNGKSALTDAEGGWCNQVLAPSAIPFQDDYPTPRAINKTEIQHLIKQFSQAVQRAVSAGADAIELHFAHGYLISSFLSPLSNTRTDEYGGSIDNRMRIAIEIVCAVRSVYKGPLFARISCQEWVNGGWNEHDSVILAKALQDNGVDVIDCSSGGMNAAQHIPTTLGYQLSFAQLMKQHTSMTVAGVGLLVSGTQCNDVIANGQADLVLLARQMLVDPHFPLRAAHQLNTEIEWLPQYGRAKGNMKYSK